VIRIERDRRTRFWAVYDGPELVAVVVYKRGAEVVAARLRESSRRDRVAAVGR
jgi:hypothetical protein